MAIAAFIIKTTNTINSIIPSISERYHIEPQSGMAYANIISSLIGIQ